MNERDFGPELRPSAVAAALREGCGPGEHGAAVDGREGERAAAALRPLLAGCASPLRRSDCAIGRPSLVTVTVIPADVAATSTVISRARPCFTALVTPSLIDGEHVGGEVGVEHRIHGTGEGDARLHRERGARARR